MGEWIEQGNRDVTAWELLERLDLSAHAFVTPSGVVVRGRDDDEGAYHAKGHNRGSLGIEFLVPGVHTYATFVEAIREPYLLAGQIEAGIEQVRAWVQRYGIPSSRVLRHSDVSPGRKHDPGAGFPWETFLTKVYG